MKLPRFALCVFFLCLAAAPFPLSAVEITNGSILLKLHEQMGGFSMYYHLKNEAAYLPFFSDQDPRTSFLALNVNGRVYRLGETLAFHVSSESGSGNAALLYDSTFLSVREEFTFIQTPGSTASNGVRITVRIKNISKTETVVGVRLLIDTSLGEEPGKPPFITDRQHIDAEKTVAGNADRFWVSRNGRLSLTGSIAASPGTAPALVHFANWKRLNEASWQPDFVEGRNFSYPPGLIDDSAVCYYYDPVTLAPKEEQSYTILLAAEDPGDENLTAWYPASTNPAGTSPAEKNPASKNSLGFAGTNDSDIVLLRDLIARLEQFLTGDSVIGEEDLSGMEKTVADIQERYGLP